MVVAAAIVTTSHAISLTVAKHQQAEGASHSPSEVRITCGLVVLASEGLNTFADEEQCDGKR